MNNALSAPEEHTSILAELHTAIRLIYGALSSAEKKLVDVILDHQHHLASYSATELARLAGVSKSTAARVFRRLGFQDFNQFRMKCRGIEPMGYSPLTNLAQRTPHPTTVRERLDVHIERERENLASMQRDSMPEELERAVQLMRDARRVWVLGFRNSYAPAFYAQSLFSHVLNDVTGKRPGCEICRCAGGHTRDGCAVRGGFPASNSTALAPGASGQKLWGTHCGAQ